MWMMIMMIMMIMIMMMTTTFKFALVSSKAQLHWFGRKAIEIYLQSTQKTGKPIISSPVVVVVDGKYVEDIVHDKARIVDQSAEEKSDRKTCEQYVGGRLRPIMALSLGDTET